MGHEPLNKYIVVGVVTVHLTVAPSHSAFVCAFYSRWLCHWWDSQPQPVSHHT